MHRSLAFLCALLSAFVAVSSACAAGPVDWLRFNLDREQRNSGQIRGEFRDWNGVKDHTNWSSAFMPSDLVGLEVSSFRGSGTRPVHFAVIREAGRLDCGGHGGDGHASGTCRFTEDASFAQLLAARGIGRPTRDQAFGLMAANARRELIDALGQARYPTPDIDDLTALAALGADGTYVNALARAGYRPRTVHTLVEFKALEITPQWIAGFQRIGYGNISGDELVQMRALDITPDYVAGFQRAGYRDLPPSKLVELKALDITPEFVRAAVGSQSPLPVEKLVEMKIFGRKQ